MKITINTEPGTPAVALFEAIEYLGEWMGGSMMPHDTILDANPVITVFPDETFIIEESDRGAAIYSRICRGPDREWVAIEVDSEGNEVRPEPPPSPFQVVGMLFVVVDACECWAPLGLGMPEWQKPGLHHQTHCPLRYEEGSVVARS